MSNDRPTGLPLGRVIEDITGFTGPISDFVDGPEPDIPVAREIHQRLRANCDSYSNAPSWFTGQTGGFQIGVGLICDKYLESQSSGGPAFDTPFTGGQCEGDNYTVNFEETGADSLQRTSFITNQRGPILEYWVGSGASNPFSNGTWSGIRSGREPFFDTAFQFPDGTWLRPLFQAGQPNQDLAGRITSVVNVTNPADDCGDPPGSVGPNPNPRPDPGLDPDDEPFEREPGQPVIPMPRVPNPFGDPVQLPNLPLPPLFAGEDEGGGSNPNVGPPITPGSPQAGNGADGDDDDFGDPPEGHIWVGFVVEISDQGLSEGLQVNSPPEPIYRATTGNYRAKYEADGEVIYSSPRDIRQRTSTYFLDLAGLTLTGARVNVPSNDSYVVTPLSQPVTEEDPPQEV